MHRRRTSSSQAAYRSARRKRQASFTPLLVLSPRRRKRHIPRFRRKAKARSFCCGSSPHERRSAFRGDPFFPAAFGYFSPEKSTSPKGVSLQAMCALKAFPSSAPFGGTFPRGKANLSHSWPSTPEAVLNWSMRASSSPTWAWTFSHSSPYHRASSSSAVRPCCSTQV